MYPIVVLLLDGLADRAHDVLKGRTANEAARTPNLDRLAARRLVRRALRRRPRPRSVERGRALVDARLPARRVSRARRLRGARPRAGGVGRARLRLRGAAAGRAARRRLVADRPPGPAARRRRRAGARRGVRRPRGRQAALLAATRVARRGRPAHRGRGRRARHRHATRSSATAIPCCDRCRSCRRRSARRARPRSGRAGRWRSSPSTRSTARRSEAGLPVFNVITLKWWGRPKRVPTFLERHGLQGTFIGESAFLRGLAHDDRARDDRGAGVGARGGRPRPAARSRRRAARRGRHVRLRAPEGDRRGRAHEGPARQARGDRVARRRAARPAAGRSRDRLHHRRPRDARVAGRHPLRRPGAVRRRRARAFAPTTCAASASSTAPRGSSGSCAGRT